MYQNVPIELIERKEALERRLEKKLKGRPTPSLPVREGVLASRNQSRRQR